MKKITKEENKGKAAETQEAAKKPGRGRRPKAALPEEKAPEKAGETAPEESPDSAPEMAGETVTEDARTADPETAPEAAPGQAGEPEAGKAPEAAAEESGEEIKAEDAAGLETAGNPEGAAEETAPEGPPEKEPEDVEKEEPGTLPAPAVIPTQVIESPFKRMKQEFSERAQIIREQMRNIQNAFITIGFQLHWIRENNMFRVLNYKNVYEYAEKEYGLKKTTCCNFISIIENYAERDGNGEVIESIADCYRNYSASQLVAMLGMDEDARQQVTPDMSVRAINRLRRGKPEPGTVADSPAPAEASAPVKEPGKGPAVEKDAENPAAEKETVPEDAVREEGQETGEKQEDESPGTAEDDTAHEEEPEDTGAAPQMDEDVRELPEESVPNGNIGTLAEIDSYTDYQSMQDELDLIMRNVFSADAPVRVKIVCVQG